MNCDYCKQSLGELIEVEVCVPNGNDDKEDYLNNYDMKSVSLCCVCVGHDRYPKIWRDEE